MSDQPVKDANKMEREEALGRLSLRLSRMAEGVDTEVDRLLDQVRAKVREGADGDALAELSDRLARQVMCSTGESPDVERRLPESLDVSNFGKLIKSMPLRSEQQKRMTDLVREISTGNSTAERQRALAELLASATAALQEVSARERGDTAKRGLFGRRGDGDTERFIKLFSSLVQRLVDHIDVMNGHQLRSQNLREGVSQLTNLSDAEGLMGDVTQEIDSIDARVRQERHQASDFLGSLRDRLDGFEQIVNEVSLSGLRSVERSEDLQSGVGEDVSDLGVAVRDGDAARVNSLIEASLAKITERLARHVTQEREEYREAQQRVSELTEKLTTLENEADELRSEIRDKSDLAIKDALTGTYNRAGYEERSAEFHARWSRSGIALSIVFIDCNKFKEINDTYGHGAGDLVLTRIAHILQTASRASDVICRYGGDEFIILAPDTEVAGAEVLANKVCEEVLDAGFNDNGKPLDVSISCGVTGLRVGDTMDAALARADEAMYTAKKLDQRVRVVVAD